MRIILADDHLMFRRSLRMLVEREGLTVVAEASNGLETLDLVESENPDVVVLDMNMPLLNGVGVIKEMVRKGLETKAIILTMFEDEVSISEAFRSGAKGYVLKTQAPTDLIQALHEIQYGKHYLSPAITDTVVGACLKQNVRDPSVLTSRERQILQLVAEGNATKDIARLLNLTVKTVDSHRNRLMRKLNACNVAGLVRHAVRQGVIRP